MAENPANRLRDKNAKLEAALIQAFTDLHDRLARSEAIVSALQSGQTAAVDSLVAQITSNFSQLFTEANATVTEIQTGEFVKAGSLTPVSFSEGLEITITLDENEGLPFIPSSVVALHSASPDDYAFARVDSYSSSTRILEGTIFLAVGEVGPHTDVQVEIGALSTLAQRTLLAQAEAARDAAGVLKQAAADWAEKATGEDVDGVGTRSAKHHAGVAGSAAVAAGSAAGAAGGSATLAGQHRDKAGQWADADEDVEVEAGKFSARHHAAKAIAAAIAAATFDPSSYYPKTETYTQAEINAAIAAAIDALIGGAPGALDTLNELAAALGDDEAFAASVTTALAARYTKSEVDALLAPIVGVQSGYEEFLSSGTYNKPAGATWIYVEGVGGGGGGEKSAASHGKGGGGGAWDFRLYRAADLPSSVAVLIGAGGTPGASPTDGGNTTFNGDLVGERGKNALDGSGGYSVEFATSNYFAGGGSNTSSIAGNSVKGGAGGGAGRPSHASLVGGTSLLGGDGGNGASAGGQTAENGQVPGGGGGGANSTAAAAGAGGAGILRVWAW